MIVLLQYIFMLKVYVPTQVLLSFSDIYKVNRSTLPEPENVVA